MATSRSRSRDVLLGFDARQRVGEVRSIWDQDRRRRFLLRTDAPYPLSADVAVWPNLFGDGLGGEELQRLGLPHAAPPSWRGPNQYLWDDLERMRLAIGTSTAKSPPVLAVGLVAPPASSTRPGQSPPYLESVTPRELGTDWGRLGFDVGDGFLTSGLTNCGYAADDRERLVRRWKARLNDFHLFTRATEAEEFAREAEQRIPEHAPFFVYSLHVLRLQEAAGGGRPRRVSTGRALG